MTDCLHQYCQNITSLEVYGWDLPDFDWILKLKSLEKLVMYVEVWPDLDSIEALLETTLPKGTKGK